MRIRFWHEPSLRMSPKQVRRATLPQAKPAGRGPWMGRVRSIGSVDIPQAESQSGGERTGHPMQRGFLAILKVED
jgi:hypothetical protein